MAEVLSAQSALKALLIVIVVMDHNDFLRQAWPGPFRPLTSHVLGFLILPFLVRAPRLEFASVRDRAVRYLVPFWWTLAACSLLYFVKFGGKSVADMGLDFLSAAVVGSAGLIKIASGFYYLWFLPCLLGLVLGITLYDAAPRYVRALVLLACAGFHLVVGQLPDGWANWIPLGVPIVAWVFPFGVAMRLALQRYRLSTIAPPAIAAFAVSGWYLVVTKRNIEVMTLSFFPSSQAATFLMQEISTVCGVVLLMWLASLWRNSRLLNRIGEQSLVIYLVHPLVYAVLFRATGLLDKKMSDDMAGFVGSTATVAVVLISYLIAIAISRIAPLRRLYTPRDWDDLRRIFKA